jgi:ADP-ribose pyrophosphatase YjhB (NUDIX family)
MPKYLVSKSPSELKESEVMDSITIDCSIFSFEKGNFKVLLVQHGEGIRKGEWGLPGGWIEYEEDINDAANRLLENLTGLKDIYLEQVKAFGNPDRFPLGRVITIGYYALINSENFNLRAGFTASEAKWVTVNEIPNLIYDHNEILKESLKRLRDKVKRAPIGFNLLPEKFTLLQLMELYQEILNQEMDKSNFRRKFLKMKLLQDVGDKQEGVSHRAAKLYRFDKKIYENLTKKGFNFEF